MLTGILRRRSTRKNTVSLGSNSKSSQEPRYGMTRAENSSLPEECVLPRSCSKNTPGERCSWETITRSVPLITNEPVVVIKGNSPMYTSCSFISLTTGLVGDSLSRMTSRTFARKGDAKVKPRCWHSLTSKGGVPSTYDRNSSRAKPLCDTIGKMDVKADCKPSFLRWDGILSSCKKPW